MPETLTITLSEEARTLYDRLITEGATPERIVASGLWLADQCQRGNLLIARNATQVESLWLLDKPEHSMAASYVATQKRRSLKDMLSSEEDIEITALPDQPEPNSATVVHIVPTDQG